MKFCIDLRTHGASSVSCEKLKQFQGASLLVFNDSVFTESDFVSISQIGDSLKKTQVGKTGRFGVGFNAVYHLTDLPSFVSGRDVVFFDPHCSFLPNVSGTCGPGFPKSRPPCVPILVPEGRINSAHTFTTYITCALFAHTVHPHSRLTLCFTYRKRKTRGRR